VVLVLLGCFWPGNDSSGPNQSFRALATALSNQFEFRLVARDRPTATGASTPARRDSWVDLGFARAHYCPIGPFGARGLRSLINQTPHDVLWLNSIFDREFSLPALAMRRLGLIGAAPTLLSPRGEFGSGALGLKSTKKRVFLEAARRLSLWRGVTLHATSEAEARDMAAGVRGAAPIVVAPNIRLPIDAASFAASPDGALRLSFVGRIAPVKQLDYALNVLACVKAKIEFNIYGPAEDSAYWARCQELIAKQPPNVRVVWHGETSNDGVVAAMAATDLFFLPTAGENFGHAIFEALSTGVPVLISDQTQWRELAALRAGWDLPLADMRLWVEAIETFAQWPEARRADYRRGAANVARKWFYESGAVEKSAQMLTACLKSAP
jgi:glycosyltransferase involved in cell wall biosynthesis